METLIIIIMFFFSFVDFGLLKSRLGKYIHWQNVFNVAPN